MSHKLIENMHWLEVEAAIKNTRVVIIPLGAAAKEHGLHLPMNNDYIIANYLRDRILENMDHVLATPTVNYNFYPAFLEYPGSISLDFETSQGIIMGICRSLHAQGCKKFYVLNTGISTLKVLAAAKNKLNEEGIIMDYLNLNDALDLPVIHDLEKQQRGSHADEIETSMMLYMAPQIVDMEKAQKDDNPDAATSGGLTRNPHATKGTYSPTGAWGDPTLATREKGEIITHILVDYLLENIAQLLGNNLAPR